MHKAVGPLCAALAIIRYNYLSVEHARRLSKCEVIGHSLEVAVVFGLLHADCLEEENFYLSCSHPGQSFPSDPVRLLPAYLHLLPPGFVRIRNFGFLANRRRAAFLPLCSQLLNAAPESALVSAPATSDSPGLAFWTCPLCGAPMRVIERLTAAQIQLRSPPLPYAWAA